MDSGVHKTIDYAFYSQLGKVLSDIRHEKKLSLSDVSKFLNVSKTSIDNWELGKARISFEKFKKMCDIYSISDFLEIDIKVKYENNN